MCLALWCDDFGLVGVVLLLFGCVLEWWLFCVVNSVVVSFLLVWTMYLNLLIGCYITLLVVLWWFGWLLCLVLFAVPLRLLRV